jgi:hypothetical protein
MKKLMAILVLALFVVSLVPAVFAQGGQNDAPNPVLMEAKEQARDGALAQNALALKAKGEDLKDRGQLLREGAKRFMEQKEKRENELKEFKAKFFEKRNIAKNKLEQARNRYQEAKEKYDLAKNRLNKARNRFEETKGLYQACKDDAKSEDCLAAKEEIKESWREKLLGHTDILIEHFEKLKSKIESNENMAEDEAVEVIAWLDGKIAEANEIKVKIEAGETKDELVAAAKELDQLWKKSKNRVRAQAGKVVTDKFAGIIVQAKQLEVKLNNILERMESNGYDVSVVEDEVEAFHTHIVDAQTAFEEAKDLYNQMADSDDAKDLREQAADKVKEAKDQLTEARDSLREILKKIKEVNSSADLEDSEEEEE